MACPYRSAVASVSSRAKKGVGTQCRHRTAPSPHGDASTWANQVAVGVRYASRAKRRCSAPAVPWRKA
eukprot:6938350-Lingulodinium_polyedra.AAC.1